MAEHHLMFPFTHGIDSDALEQALQLASYNDAALLLLTVIITPQGAEYSLRPEQLQQAQDLQILARQKAKRHGVEMLYREVRSQDFIHAILLIAQEQMCDTMLLFLRNGQGVCLQREEIRQVLEQNKHKFYLVRLQNQKTRAMTHISTLWQWFKPRKNATVFTLEHYTGSREYTPHINALHNPKVQSRRRLETGQN